MKKNLLLLISVVFACAGYAQTAIRHIHAWYGEGTHYAVLAIDFKDSTQTSAFLWGYRYDADSISAQEMLDSLFAADPKLSGNITNFATDIFYKDLKGETPSNYAFFWSSFSKDSLTDWQTNNGNSTKLGNGQWFGLSFVSNWPGEAPLNPVSADRIPANVPLTTTNDIIQWIGEGENQAVLVLDFGTSEVRSSYAWGLRFDEDSITGQVLLDKVIAADSNLSGAVSGYITDIFYRELAGVTPTDFSHYWLTFSANGDYAWVGNLGNSTKLGNGQWFGAEFTNTYPSPGPRAAFTALVPFSGGTVIEEEENTPTVEGITYDSPLIVAWATGIEVTRGYINAQDTSATFEGSNRASYGIPENALGAADNNALHVVSLGDAGEAVLTFDKPITNGEGFDFVVFENGFDVQFLELAFVEVSSDGENFVRFPTLSLTQDTNQIAAFDPINPSKVYGFAGLHKIGVGTPFDLEVLAGVSAVDINAITHVKIVDVIGAIAGEPRSLDSEGNAVNDPFPTAFSSGGFDLDAVGVIHQQVEVGLQKTATENRLSVYPNPATGGVVSFSGVQQTIEVSNTIGELVLRAKNTDKISVVGLKPGIYIIHTEVGSTKLLVE